MKYKKHIWEGKGRAKIYTLGPLAAKKKISLKLIVFYWMIKEKTNGCQHSEGKRVRFFKHEMFMCTPINHNDNQDHKHTHHP